MAKSHHGRGIGRLLVIHFEEEIRARGRKLIRVAARMVAVPFYLRLGYKKSTGVRTGWSFNGYGLPIQPMKKVIIP
ncbi:MAG: GNAT family N-acetyltransferase [Anaerolineales bacterium]|nr:GNAT family N-acetyltransferase [Anaerolineales bacterium]